MRCPLLALVVVLFLSAPAEAKDKKPGKPSVKAVAEAIENGAAWLQTQYKDGFETTAAHAVPELVLLTLAHAGVKHKSPVFQEALKQTLAADLRHTYRVATQAMALSHINPYLYRARIAHCGQWLVDTQLTDGEWGYPGGAPGTARGKSIAAVKAPVTEAQAKGGPRAPWIEIICGHSGTDVGPQGMGDFSNTQFALLGLRACAAAHIKIPASTWRRALKYQISFQQKDGSFGYVLAGEQDGIGFASLTCAGMVGIAICHHGLGKKNARSHPAVKKGSAWLARKWDATQNVDIEESTIIAPSTWQYYHLYAVERVGRVLGVKKLGKQNWFNAGAHWILPRQKPDGSWEDPAGGPDTKKLFMRTADTCFAILFLSLSTPPLTG